MKNLKQTGKKAGTAASKVLKGSASKLAKKAAGSAMAQRPYHAKSKKK